MAILSLRSVLVLAARIAVIFAQCPNAPDKPQVETQKPPVEPKWDIKNVNVHFAENLNLSKFNIDQWDQGWVPKGCVWLGEQGGYSAADFEVYNVTYDDCFEPWVFCRHKKSTTSVETMADAFGHLPIGMRLHTQHPVAFPTFPKRTTTGMASSAGCIAIKDDSWVYDTLIHEATHCLDYTAESGQFSNSDKWHEAYNKDERSISEYATENGWEDKLAEAGVFGLYDFVVPGGIKSIQPNYKQVQHQYETFQEHYKHIIWPNITKCQCRHPLWNSTFIPV